VTLYQILCAANQAVYIGSTVGPPRSRWKDHLGALKKRRHRNAHLQRIADKYGIDSLTFTVLSSLPANTPELDLRKLEAQKIRDLKSSGARVCNIASCTIAPMTGRKHSLESIETMRRVQRARADEEKALGIKREVSEETRRLLSLSSAGRTKNADQRKAMSLRVLGVRRSPETKLRMSQAQLAAGTHKGKAKPPKQRAAMSAARKDKKRIIAHQGDLPPQEFESVTAAAKALGLNKGNVSEAANLPGRKIKGWSFSFVSRGSSK